MLRIKAKIGLEPILKDLQSNTLTKLCYSAYQNLFNKKWKYKIIGGTKKVVLTFKLSYETHWEKRYFQLSIKKC